MSVKNIVQTVALKQTTRKEEPSSVHNKILVSAPTYKIASVSITNTSLSDHMACVKLAHVTHYFGPNKHVRTLSVPYNNHILNKLQPLSEAG